MVLVGNGTAVWCLRVMIASICGVEVCGDVAMVCLVMAVLALGHGRNRSSNRLKRLPLLQYANNTLVA